MCAMEIRDLHKEILFDFRNSGGIDNQSKDRDEEQNDLKVRVLKFLRAFIVCFFQARKKKKRRHRTRSESKTRSRSRSSTGSRSRKHKTRYTNKSFKLGIFFLSSYDHEWIFELL